MEFTYDESVRQNYLNRLKIQQFRVTESPPSVFGRRRCIRRQRPEIQRKTPIGMRRSRLLGSTKRVGLVLQHIPGRILPGQLA